MTPSRMTPDAKDPGGTKGSGGYPETTVEEIEISDGRSAMLRPIRADDGERLVSFHDALSPHAVYERYFTLHAHLSPSEVEHYTHVDYVDRFALVVEFEDRIIAVGRYERIPASTEAEVAFLVADAYQHQGIGTLLLRRLAQAARTRGIRTFVALTLAENRDMLDVFLNSGFHVDSTCEFGTMTVRFPIVPEGAGPEMGSSTCSG
jgi:GNAT superfamily N-acetyltransferase